MANAVVGNMAVFNRLLFISTKWIENKSTSFLFLDFRMMSTSLTMILLIILPIYTWCATSTVTANLVTANIDGLKSQFQAAMKSYSDVASLHYTLAGVKELGVQSPDSFCNEIKRLVEKSNIESIYHATEAARTLANCKVDFFMEMLVFVSTLFCSYLSRIIGRLSHPLFNLIKVPLKKSTMPFVQVLISVYLLMNPVLKNVSMH